MKTVKLAFGFLMVLGFLATGNSSQAAFGGAREFPQTYAHQPAGLVNSASCENKTDEIIREKTQLNSDRIQ